MGNVHLTNKGILENKTFSVNLPSEDMVAVTDHIGMVSGTQEDKSGLFDLFYGELDTAPMIEHCKVTMEVKLIDHLKLPTDHLRGRGRRHLRGRRRAHQRRGRHRQAQAAVLFDMASKKYWGLGEPVAKCWSVGKELVPGG